MWEGARFCTSSPSIQCRLGVNMDYSFKEIKNTAESKLKEYQRVLKISDKPDREEFEMSAKVTGAGMIIIGLLGFLFYLRSSLLPKLL